MKKTKTRSILMTVFALALMLVMYNCKKDDPLPEKPDETVSKELDGVAIKPVTITPPAAVTSTAASVEVSAKATEVNAGLGSIATTGTVPASVSTAGAAVTTAVPAADVTTLSNVSQETIDAVKAGGAVPAEIKAALDKAIANPALQEYLPKFTLPTVAGKQVGARVGVITQDNLVEAVMDASDACLAAAEATFQAKKTQLDAAKATNDAAITAAYNTAISPLAAQETSCKAGIPAVYVAYRAAVEAQVNSSLQSLEAAKDKLGALYPVLKALINITALDAYAGLNNLQAAEIAACAAKTAAATTNAQAARDANLAASQAAYAVALKEANDLKGKLMASCHNQGGGI